jgi:hypothetical protein
MLSLVIAAGALVLIVLDILRPPAQRPAPLWFRVARAAPFVIVSALSLFAASQAPRGRKPFQVDFSLSREDLALSMSKVAHLRSIAVILLLAVVAFGTQRLVAAFGATMLVGIGWELAETTVIGHYARLADLAPNITSGAFCVLAIAGIRWVLQRRARPSPPAGLAAAGE